VFLALELKRNERFVKNMVDRSASLIKLVRIALMFRDVRIGINFVLSI